MKKLPQIIVYFASCLRLDRFSVQDVQSPALSYSDEISGKARPRPSPTKADLDRYSLTPYPRKDIPVIQDFLPDRDRDREWVRLQRHDLTGKDVGGRLQRIEKTLFDPREVRTG